MLASKLQAVAMQDVVRHAIAGNVVLLLPLQDHTAVKMICYLIADSSTAFFTPVFFFFVSRSSFAKLVY